MKKQFFFLISVVIFMAVNTFAARVNFGNRPRFERQQENTFTGYNYEKPSIPFNYEPPQVSEGLPEEPKQLPENEESSTDLVESSTIVQIPEEQNAPQEESDNEDVPLNQRFPAINFFPITFGGFGGSRSGDFDTPFGTIAIANSFSTGRGGVSNSQATAFGDARSLRSRDKEDRGKSLFN